MLPTTLQVAHPLSNSTLLDSCGATHLVNRKEFLIPGSFRPARPDEVVESGYDRHFDQRKRETPAPEGTARRQEESIREDPVLSEVVLYRGVSTQYHFEARLRDSGIWYMGLDCSLRYGNEHENVTVEAPPKVQLSLLRIRTTVYLLRCAHCDPTSAAGRVGG